jgi:hypothetical protein
MVWFSRIIIIIIIINIEDNIPAATGSSLKADTGI